jgi:chemotaxis protein MotB
MVASRDSLQISNDSLGRVIAVNNTTIKNLDRQLSEEKSELISLQSEMKTVRENYEKFKSTSSSEAQQLMTQLENMQKDLAARENKIQDIQRKLSSRDSVVNALWNTLNDALLNFAKSGLTVSIKEGKVYVSLSNQLLFRSGSTTIDKSGQEALRGLASVLNNQPNIIINVEGHTDNAKVINNARFKDNWELSVLRATEVVKYLTESCNVDPTRIIASGRSEYFPIEPGDTPEIRAANRRTEIILTPNLGELYQIMEEKKK